MKLRDVRRELGVVLAVMSWRRRLLYDCRIGVPEKQPPLHDCATSADAYSRPGSTDETEVADESGGRAESIKDDLVGELLAGRYRVDSLLGTGGMGTVYLGFHVALERRVAIKVIQPRFGSDPIIAQRFSQEARAASAIGHEHIVQVIDFGQVQGGVPYLVMELLEGEDLEATLRRVGPFSWRRVIHIAEQIARALAAAHGQGIVHRDIKPANCYRVIRDGDLDYIKVLDFGLAKVLGGGTRVDAAMTRTGALLGTPGYIAPELYRGHAADHRVDIYALGALMHKLLTGELPPVVRGARVDALCGVPAPAVVLSVLAKALSEAPDERYPTADAFARALHGLESLVSERPSAEPVQRVVRAVAAPTMVYTRCRAYMVLVHGTRVPSDEEWDRYVAQIEAHGSSLQGFLIITAGGGPTSSQRRGLKLACDRLGINQVRTAVVSSDRLTRGIVIALSLVGPNIRAFRPDALEQALTHIQAVGPDRAALIAEIEWLRQQVGMAP
ncbi:MAG: serine/threonine protein kinase [Myxococcales bacterium]|nr:serine/threonine protein kinase [Myxococcales bacterium]